MSRSVSHFSGTDLDTRFRKKSPIKQKRMLKSVSEKCETDLDIRFIDRFQKNLMKWMSRSISHFSETDFNICLVKKVI